MKIAIVSKYVYHFECLGFLLESLEGHEITVYAPAEDREFHKGYIAYFTRIFANRFRVIYIRHFLNPNIINEYDQVIKLTSNDSVIHHPRVISILHTVENKDISKKNICLTPAIQNDNCIHFLSAYNPLSPQNLNPKNIITYIGYFEDRFMDADFDSFITSLPHYQFVFIVWGGSYMPFEKYSNVTLRNHITTDELMSLVEETKYILLRKPPFQELEKFSGAIGLALSYCKPLIIHQSLKELYQIPAAISFENGCSETIFKINSITISQYGEMVEYLGRIREMAISENKKKMSNLLLDAILPI
jgi:hypothetical protein